MVIFSFIRPWLYAAFVRPQAHVSRLLDDRQFALKDDSGQNLKAE